MMGRRLGLATLIVTLLAAGTAWAAFEPDPGSPYPTGNEPYAVYAADFDGDGRPDLAVLNGTSSNFNIYLRQAAGGFVQEAGSPIAVTGGPSFAVVSDFNADARPDIAVAGFTGFGVSLLIRQVAGGFAVQNVGVGFQASAIGAADFNSDGRTDLVVANWFSNQVQLFLANGNGGFTGGATFPTGANPRQIEVVDVNGDSQADIVVTNASSDSVTTLVRSAAGGGFVTEGTTPVGDAPQDLVAGDFNADGRTDLAVANNAGSVSVLLRNAANTGFSDEAGSPIAIGGALNGITTADFNRDGRPDLAVVNGTDVVVLLRNAAGGFTADTPVPAAGSYGVAAADFDSDGTPDIATSALPNRLFVFRNPAPVQPPVQTPTPAPPVATPTPAPTATPVAPPVAGQRVNATPVSGEVKVRLPGTKNFVELSQAASLPVGTTVDTRDGKVTLLAAGQGGQADFYDGIFKISQTKGSKPLTTLTLTETLSCPKKGKAASAAAKKKKVRRLWGDGKGRFRTSGKYAAATVRGTKWLVSDYCDRTTVKVTQGVVSVRDSVKKRTVTVRKGKSYTARAKRR